MKIWKNHEWSEYDEQDRCKKNDNAVVKHLWWYHLKGKAESTARSKSISTDQAIGAKFRLCDRRWAKATELAAALRVQTQQC